MAWHIRHTIILVIIVVVVVVVVVASFCPLMLTNFKSLCITEWVCKKLSQFYACSQLNCSFKALFLHLVAVCVCVQFLRYFALQKCWDRRACQAASSEFSALMFNLIAAFNAHFCCLVFYLVFRELRELISVASWSRSSVDNPHPLAACVCRFFRLKLKVVSKQNQVWPLLVCQIAARFWSMQLHEFFSVDFLLYLCGYMYMLFSFNFSWFAFDCSLWTDTW